MLNTLLAVANELSGEYPKYIPKSEAAIDALLGFVVVFLGIAFLVGVIWLVGYVMRHATGKVSAKKEAQTSGAEENVSAALAANGDELSEETVAVISAAITAYYSEEKPKCEFTVKRIKRI